MLAVWLPLLGNLKNQGLCTVTQSSGTPVWLDNGKIGQGLSLNSRVGFSCPSLSGCKKFTVAFWVKIEDNPNIETNWLDVFRFNDQKADNSSTGQLRAETSYGNTSYYGVHWHDNATNAIASSLPTHYNGNRGIWKHCVLTVDSDVALKAYTDGVLVSTKATSNGGHITGTFYIGESGVIGCMNDVRIWKDQILSDDEIYELSSGLIAWFPLNPKPVYKITGDNIFTTSNIAKANSSSSYSVSAISDTSFRLYTNKNVAYASTKQTVASLGLTVGKRYRMKCKIDITRLDTRIIVGLRDSNNTYRASTGNLYEGGIYEYEFVLTSDMSYLSFLGTYESSQCDITFSDIEIYELQEDNIIYDISGYQRNGTKTATLTASIDTPKYDGSYLFTSSDYIGSIEVPRTSMLGDWTIAWWSKSSNMNTRMPWVFAGGKGLNIYVTNGVFCLNQGDSGKNPIKNQSNENISCTPYLDTWHHYAINGDGTTNKFYIDGELVGSPITYRNPTSDTFYISGYGYAMSTTYAWIGNLSDVRIYAKCLSADDIMNLYQNSLISQEV